MCANNVAREIPLHPSRVIGFHCWPSGTRSKVRLVRTTWVVFSAAAGAVLAGFLAACEVANEEFCCMSEASCAARGVSAPRPCQDTARSYCDEEGAFGPINTCIEPPLEPE